MEGSPVRGQQRLVISQLNQSSDLQTFHRELVQSLNSELKHAEIFLALMDAENNTLQLPAWIKSHMLRHPGLQKKLELGEMVGIGSTEDNPVPRPATAARSSVVLIPLMADGSVAAVIGLVSPSDGPQLSAEDIEWARQFAHDAAAICARLKAIESLRSLNQQLSANAERLTEIEDSLNTVVEERNTLQAIMQMRSHQQVNIAHELRTPLAAIRGYARMLLDGRGGEINSRQKDYLTVVTENTNKLINLVGWMSLLTELSAQHLKLDSFDLREIWTDCATQKREKLEAKSLKLVQHIAEESFSVMGDREKLAYVFTELITAAVDLADPGGTITVDLSHGREKEVHFKISEAGKSLPPETISKIFDRPFNTVTKPMAQNTESGAISLYGVYDVVGMHGGRVFVNSAAGQGASFLFTLPAITAGGEKNHEQAVHSSRRRR